MIEPLNCEVLKYFQRLIDIIFLWEPKRQIVLSTDRPFEVFSLGLRLANLFTIGLPVLVIEPNPPGPPFGPVKLWLISVVLIIHRFVLLSSLSALR